jgi:hypothetical protein
MACGSRSAISDHHTRRAVLGCPPFRCSLCDWTSIATGYGPVEAHGHRYVDVTNVAIALGLTVLHCIGGRFTY